jgi:hypothetical protein
MTYADKEFAMDTVMLEISIQEHIDLSDLTVVHQKSKAEWFVARKSTGRGIYKILDSEF